MIDHKDKLNWEFIGIFIGFFILGIGIIIQGIFFNMVGLIPIGISFFVTIAIAFPVIKHFYPEESWHDVFYKKEDK